MTFLEVYSIIIPTITILALIYTSIEDILFREVRKDFIWLIMIGIGLIFDILYLIFYDGVRAFSEVLAEMLLSVVLGFLIGFILFYIGVWGGADSKAIWALSVLAPLHPFLEVHSLPTLPLNTIMIIDSSVLSILLNSCLIAIFYPIILMLVNTFSLLKNPLFKEVQGTSSQKLRCFLFGYKKKISKINPKKLHYDFLEELPMKEFSGRFIGDFTGKLDGSFLGIFSGTLDGEFHGKIIGKLISSQEQLSNSLKVEEIITQAERLSNEFIVKKDDDEEELDFVLKKYQEYFIDKESNNISTSKDENIVNYNGKFYGEISGCFIGLIDGFFKGALEGDIIGKMLGDFVGISKKGKIQGTQKQPSSEWRIKIRVGLDDQTIMEKRQLRTLWQLQTHKKDTVWVTPVLPFIFFMLLGYLLYLFFGNFALFLFRIG